MENVEKTLSECDEIIEHKPMGAPRRHNGYPAEHTVR